MKINNINIQNTYSTYLLDSNYKDILCFPPLKKLNSNDWAEYYGKEYDTDSPKLDTLQITLSFFSEANQYEPFINFLTAQTYNTFHFEELNKTFQLRLVLVKKAKKEQTYISYDITFASDFPLQGYNYTAPNATLPTSGFTIDGIDISKYGIYLLEENQNTLLKDYEVKEHLTINSTAISGVQYAQHANQFKERTLELHCYISQPISTFWQLYETLLYNLTKQGERTINIPTSFGGAGGGLNAIYQKASIKNALLIGNTLKVEFTLTLTLV